MREREREMGRDREKEKKESGSVNLQNTHAQTTLISTCVHSSQKCLILFHLTLNSNVFLSSGGRRQTKTT